MRITTPPSLGAVQTAQQAPRADRARPAFALPDAPKAEAQAASAARPGVAAAGLETLLAVQGLQPDERRERRRRAVQRGRRALDLLDELKLAMLSGATMPAVLLKLRGLTAQRPQDGGGAGTGEEGLDGVLAEIDLRVQVELAKHEAAAAKAG